MILSVRDHRARFDLRLDCGHRRVPLLGEEARLGSEHRRNPYSGRLTKQAGIARPPRLGSLVALFSRAAPR